MWEVGGVLADLRWGKFKTIAVGTVLAGIAHILSVLGESINLSLASAQCALAALRSLQQSGSAFIPFLIAMLLLGGSTGIIHLPVGLLKASNRPDHGGAVYACRGFRSHA